MIIIPPVLYRRRQRVKEAAKSTPAPVAMALVAVAYDEGVSVQLQFNQPISIGAFATDLLTVSDEMTGFRYIGGVATLTAPDTVSVSLTILDDSVLPGVLLYVDDGGGIVGTNGAPWAGAAALPIPFG